MAFALAFVEATGRASVWILPLSQRNASADNCPAGELPIQPTTLPFSETSFALLFGPSGSSIAAMAPLIHRVAIMGPTCVFAEYPTTTSDEFRENASLVS